MQGGEELKQTQLQINLWKQLYVALSKDTMFYTRCTAAFSVSAMILNKEHNCVYAKNKDDFFKFAILKSLTS